MQSTYADEERLGGDKKNSVADFNFEKVSREFLSELLVTQKLDSNENVAKKHFHYDKSRLFIAVFQR